MFLTRPHGGARLYQNLGGFRFRDVTAAARLESPLADHWPAGATFADVDGDGLLDLYVCGYRSANKLFINLGDGTFRDRAEEFGLAFAGASISISFADYDRDGDLDAFLLTNRLAGQASPDSIDVTVRGKVAEIPEEHRENIGALVKPDGSLRRYTAAQADRLFRNDGGKFVDVSESAGIRGYYHGLSSTWWDYDADGWIDLYVANDFFGPDHLYRNNGDGTFTDVIASAVPNTPWFSMGSDAGDLNNDGRLDYIASDMAATTHYKQKVQMGDMDADGWFLEHGLPRQYMRNAIYLGTGTGRFLEIANLTGMASTDWTWAVKILDLDLDGRNDVFFSNGMTRQFFHADLRKEVRDLKVKTGENKWADYEPQNEPNRAFRNLGELRFADSGKSWGLDHDGVSFGAAAGDLDGDGDIDLIVNHFTEPAGVYRNRSVGENAIVVALRGAGRNRHALGAEVRIRTRARRQVRVLSPVRGYMGCDTQELHFGLGAAEVVDEMTVRWPSGRQQILTELRANHRYLISEASDARPIPVEEAPRTMFGTAVFAPSKHRESAFDDFAAQPLLPNRLSRSGPAMAWADVTTEGKIDLFYGGAKGQPAQLWIQLADGNLANVPTPAFVEDRECEDLDAEFFDADGDGDLDLYVVSGSVEATGASQLQDRLYINSGRGFTRSPEGALPEMAFSGSCVAAADYDGDGDFDLFVGARVKPGEYPLAPPSRLLNNDGSGKFTDAGDGLGLDRIGMVTDALWADANGDALPDLLVTTEYGPVHYFENSGGKLAQRTPDAGLIDLRGWWNCIASADIDADGDLDFAVGNFGHNTKYHASSASPQRIYYGDFEGRGKPNIVEAHPDGDRFVPNRGRSCSSDAMPYLKEKFKTYHAFAIAGLEEIYTPEKLRGAYHLVANELATGILVNDGTGTFEFKPLPRLAQIAPCFGLAFLDADGDGKQDLYVSQNFYGPQRETGRMAGGVGLLLAGHGNGEFTGIWPAESGISIPDDARGAATIDLNGDGADDLAVAVNNGPVKLLINRRPR